MLEHFPSTPFWIYLSAAGSFAPWLLLCPTLKDPVRKRVHKKKKTYRCAPSTFYINASAWLTSPLNTKQSKNLPFFVSSLMFLIWAFVHVVSQDQLGFGSLPRTLHFFLWPCWHKCRCIGGKGCRLHLYHVSGSIFLSLIRCKPSVTYDFWLIWHFAAGKANLHEIWLSVFP